MKFSTAHIAVLLLASTSLATGCTSLAPPSDVVAQDAQDEQETDPEVLLAADRDFAIAASERGIEGWLSYFDERSVKPSLTAGDTHVVQGLDAIRASDTALFADPAIEFTWEPEVGGFIDPGELGFTRGVYTIVRIGDDGNETRLGSGTYLTVWRKTKAGWRVALDAGVPDQ